MRESDDFMGIRKPNSRLGSWRARGYFTVAQVVSIHPRGRQVFENGILDSASAQKSEKCASARHYSTEMKRALFASFVAIVAAGAMVTVFTAVSYAGTCSQTDRISRLSAEGRHGGGGTLRHSGQKRRLSKRWGLHDDRSEAGQVQEYRSERSAQLRLRGDHGESRRYSLDRSLWPRLSIGMKRFRAATKRSGNFLTSVARKPSTVFSRCLGVQRMMEQLI